MVHMNFQVFYFFFSRQVKVKPEDKEHQKKNMHKTRKDRRPNKRAHPAASSVQCSKACRDKRTARRGIRRKLPKQMPSRGAKYESKACQLTRKAGAPTTVASSERSKSTVQGLEHFF